MSSTFASSATHTANATSNETAAASEESGSSTLDPDIPRLSVSHPADLSLIQDSLFHPSLQQYVDIEADAADDVAGQDDVEASFIRSERPQCSKTTLVSCLSSRSTSPGPLSPLLSDDDVCMSEASSSASSRRPSESCPNPRVRFKRGCVITAVNLTWAAASYDRAPIDVAQSLDMKRCHSIDCNGEDADADGDRWVPFSTDTTISRSPSPPLASSPCTAAHTAYAYANTIDHEDYVAGDMHTPEHSPVPTLLHDDSSGSESDECYWLNKVTLQTFGNAARALSSPICEEDSSMDYQGAQDTKGLRLEISALSPSPEATEEGSMTPKARRDSCDESFPPALASRKCTKYNLSKFARQDDLYDCEALGGF